MVLLASSSLISKPDFIDFAERPAAWDKPLVGARKPWGLFCHCRKLRELRSRPSISLAVSTFDDLEGSRDTCGQPAREQAVSCAVRAATSSFRRKFRFYFGFQTEPDSFQAVVLAPARRRLSFFVAGSGSEERSLQERKAYPSSKRIGQDREFRAPWVSMRRSESRALSP